MTITSKIGDWFKRRMAILALAFSNVEKNALSQTGEGLSSDVTQNRRMTQGQLADSLINGEVTQEVLNLKWRTYKILKATEGVTAEIVGYDEDGMPITRVSKRDNKKALKKVKLDEFDNYELEMVLDNSEIAFGGNDAMDNEYVSIYDVAEKNYDDKGEVVSATHGKIDALEYFATHKTETPLKIIRESVPNFFIENFTKKLNVRNIDGEHKLLEFYVSKYPDEYNRTSRLFLSALKKAIENPVHASMLEFEGVEFVTYKTLGVSDYLEYQYEIQSFDKIVEFGGYYVIKFIASVKVDGRDIMEEHRVVELDKKYEQKAKK
ncbi:MAG: hypothetical protein E6R13_03000 [Spirochaetes bacterium]|nr:MAG: hypothetical protein E6R13_03000 [Spirochaetota bacterium]